MASRAGFLALALVLATAAATGCKKKNEAGKAGASGATGAIVDPAALGPMDPEVAEVHKGLADFRTEMCACANVECADGVQLRMGKWLMTFQDKFQEIDRKSTPAQIEAAKTISLEHEACAKKLAGR